MNNRPLIIISILIVVLTVILFIVWGAFRQYGGIGEDIETIAGRTSPLSTTDSNEGRASKKVTLARGESGNVDGLSITFTDIRSDERCPIDAVCMRAGEVEILATLATEAMSRSVRLSFPGASLTFDGYRVSVKEVDPIRVSGNVPEPEEYRVTFSIEQLQ